MHYSKQLTAERKAQLIRASSSISIAIGLFIIAAILYVAY